MEQNSSLDLEIHVPEIFADTCEPSATQLDSSQQV